MATEQISSADDYMIWLKGPEQLLNGLWGDIVLSKTKIIYMASREVSEKIYLVN